MYRTASHSTLSLSAFWQSVKVPKGFENFFPKNTVGKQPPKTTTQPQQTQQSQTPPKQPGEKKIPNDEKSKTTKNKKKKKKSAFADSSFGNSNSDNPNAEPHPALLLALLVAIVAGRTFLDSPNRSSKEITYKDFYAMLEDGHVEKLIVINRETARIVLKEGVNNVVLSSSSSSSSSSTSTTHDPLIEDFNDETSMEYGSQPKTTTSERRRSRAGTQTPLYHFTIGSVEALEDKLTKAQHELGLQPKDFVPVTYKEETDWFLQGIKFIPTLAIMGVIAYAVRSQAGKGGAGPGGIFQIGKSNAKRIQHQDVKINFNDVAGCQEAKKEIMEFVDFLKDSSRFTKLGAKIPKGALLCGPPGTGKTLLAKAVAGEAGVPFFSISGSDFIEMFVGVGPSRVRDLFKEARANAPCIIFIDEIDAIGRQRGRGGFSGGNDERENTLNQLLVEMDGFSPMTGVVVLAGTNRADILDSALTRPGRFDRQIQVDKPDLQGRKEIFQVHLKGIKLEDKIDEIAGRLAGLTPGFAGADIANICNEAAIVGARRKAESVSLEDFEKATDRIIGGLESHKIMSKEERLIVAHHEAGHAVAGWFLEHADPLLKVTIIPRSSGALGYAQYLPKEVFLRTEDQIMDIVCMALAGRAAEEVFFGDVTTGASDDLRRVTQLVYSTIQVYGMNSRVGQLAFPQKEDGMPGDKPYSNATAEAMDEEARSVVNAAYQRTLALVREKKQQVEAVALFLLEKETITHDDVFDLIGPRPFPGDDAYNEFVSKRHRVAPNSEDNEVVRDEEEESTDPTLDGPLTPGLA